jgi:hypothetical protein
LLPTCPLPIIPIVVIALSLLVQDAGDVSADLA